MWSDAEIRLFKRNPVKDVYSCYQKSEREGNTLVCFLLWGYIIKKNVHKVCVTKIMSTSAVDLTWLWLAVLVKSREKKIELVI